MTRHHRAGLTAALLLPVVLIAAGCGGAAPPVAPTEVPSGGVSAAPSTEPDVSIDPNVSIDPGALPSFDLGALAGGLPGVDSYRTSLSTDGVLTYESVVVTKPVLSKAITTYGSDGAVEQRFIVIDKAVWQAQGADGEFESIPEAMAASLLMFFDPTMMFSAYASLQWDQAATDLGTQDKNGQPARHLRIDPTSIVGAGAGLPAGSAIDVWVAEAGYLLAWEMSGFGTGQDISIQVTNVNDPANVVEAP